MHAYHSCHGSFGACYNRICSVMQDSDYLYLQALFTDPYMSNVHVILSEYVKDEVKQLRGLKARVV